MSEWRKKALQQMPGLRHIVRKERDPMRLWIELQLRLFGLYDVKPLNRATVTQIYRYARWCFFLSGDEDVVEAVAYAFYEHLPVPDNPAVRQDVPNYLTHEEFLALETVFRYHLSDEQDFEQFHQEFVTHARKTNL